MAPGKESSKIFAQSSASHLFLELKDPLSEAAHTESVVHQYILHAILPNLKRGAILQKHYLSEKRGAKICYYVVLVLVEGQVDAEVNKAQTFYNIVCALLSHNIHTAC